ncbi:MAG: ATP-grasp domain-containing protein [Ruminococcaceae bacterium]|nr:ATP-grasp domain-containing protein [Oscillospiraceae bacterium]
MKKALVLCGGIPQIALIKELKNRDFTVLLADMNENVAARPFADEFYKVSVLDVEAITNLAKEKKVDCVLTVCADQVLEVTAKVSETLGLPCYIDFETAQNVSNKAYMKTIFKQNGVPTANFKIQESLCVEELADLNYPLIVKPVDAYSSRGVTKVLSPEELVSAFNKATSISRAKAAIVEEFVIGNEISVDVYVEEGKAKVLCLTDLYKIGEGGKFIINRSKIPATATADVAQKISEAAQKIADAFGLKNTPMLMQVLVNGQDISVVEFCARTGGGVKFLMIEKFTGFDVVKAVVDLTLGEKPRVKPFTPPKTITVNEFVYCNSGELANLCGFEELLADGTIADYKQFKLSGSKFGEINGSGDRVAYFSIEAEKEDELLLKHNKANKTISALNPQGQDIIRHDLLEKFSGR